MCRHYVRLVWAAYDALKRKYPFEDRPPVVSKGLGSIDVWKVRPMSEEAQVKEKSSLAEVLVNKRRKKGHLDKKQRILAMKNMLHNAASGSPMITPDGSDVGSLRSSPTQGRRGSTQSHARSSLGGRRASIVSGASSRSAGGHRKDPAQRRASMQKGEASGNKRHSKLQQENSKTHLLETAVEM